MWKRVILSSSALESTAVPQQLEMVLVGLGLKQLAEKLTNARTTVEERPFRAA